MGGRQQGGGSSPPEMGKAVDGEIAPAPYLLKGSCKPCCLCVVALKKVQPVPSDVWNL